MTLFQFSENKEMKEIILKTQSITKHFQDPVEFKVLDEISFEVYKGEFLTVIGKSGCGKSTLLYILSTMDTEFDGELFIDNQNISRWKQDKLAAIRNEKIGFVFQFHYLLADFNVLENILLPVWADRSAKLERAEKLLEIMDLTSRKDHMPHELSGGEQQRVALARALINEPKILFADEPTGNLDRQTGGKIENLMFDICSRLKTTLVVVTHSEELAKSADRLVKLRDGQII